MLKKSFSRRIEKTIQQKMYLVFPNFNIYSTPLLILVLQGFVFAFLLLKRYFSKQHISDLFLSLLLIITGYHTTTYIIGFMGWYDTYQNTKINYWLINFLTAIGPLIYFYVKSLTQPYFKFRKIDYLHFLPALIYFVYRVIVFIYDAQQPGFDDVQNGRFENSMTSNYIGQFVSVFVEVSIVTYTILAIRIYWKYRKNIVEYFSNTYQVELNFIRNFLILFVGLYLIEFILDITEYSFFETYWKQRWWGRLADVLTMFYVGMMSYFSDLSKLYNLQPAELETTNPIISNDKITKNNSEIDELKKRVSDFMEKEQPYLNPEITLPDLAKALNISTNQLSQTINAGFNKNFNEFINEYRVEMVKTKLKDGSLAHLSLLGIAMECGFNSKATFNRVFKKVTNISPSEFAKRLK